MTKINLLKKEKELRYVTVYNKLFKMIIEGTFPEGSRLPSEPELAKDLGVSRTTLRQSLALLQDDGLIRNVRGKGNYILKSTSDKKNGLETIGHPVYKCIDNDIDEIDIRMYLEPTTDYFNKILIKKTPAVVLVDRWYKFEGTLLAYTFSLLPIETIAKFNLDLNNHESMKKFLEEHIYEIATDVLTEIKHSNSGNFASKTTNLSSDNKFNLIQETIYENSEFPIVSNKHYLPLKTSSIVLHPKK